MCSATICSYLDTHSLISLFVALFHPHVFVSVALLFLWRCVAFVFCMSSPSDLLWPPSAREHSADPSGKVCTLASQQPVPASSRSTVPVTRVAQFYPNYFVTVAFSFTIFTGVMCSCATLRLSPSHPVHLTTTEVASPQPQLLFHLGHVLI